MRKINYKLLLPVIFLCTAIYPVKAQQSEKKVNHHLNKHTKTKHSKKTSKYKDSKGQPQSPWSVSRKGDTSRQHKPQPK